MISPVVGHIARLTLNVVDLEQSVRFYVDALQFRVEARVPDRARLAIGSQQIDLIAQPDAAPYPEPRAANDPWFQHFAIVVANMEAAYEQLSRFAPEPITHGGPQLLPPSTGSVTAYKFRDPDGHPLELSYLPGSIWSRAAAPEGVVFLGIDHTALAVRDLDASIAFYTELGFELGARSINQGPEQARLDGLVDAVVDIVTLLTPRPGMHIELLRYRSLAPAAARETAPDDIVATTMVLAPLAPAARIGAELLDPDGHRLRLDT